MPVAPVAPIASALPLGSASAGPISETLTAGLPKLMSASVCFAVPAETHWSVAGRYFSAVPVEEICTVSTLPSGSNVHVSSSIPPCLVLPTVPNSVPALTQLSSVGSQTAAWVPPSPPSRTRPSGSTTEPTSPLT